MISVKYLFFRAQTVCPYEDPVENDFPHNVAVTVVSMVKDARIPRYIAT